MKLKKKAKKGFTLIELLIVVAIIAILAAIAIPQFSQYRIRGYNAAANSDLRNTKIGLEAFKTDWSVYPSTKDCATDGTSCSCAAGGGEAGLVIGPRNPTVSLAAGSVKSPAPATDTKYSFGISSGVSMSVATDANAVSYVMITSHASGDEIYGADSDNTSVRHAGKDSAGVTANLTDKVPGGALAAGVAATASVDDLSTAPFVSM